jgi:putative FmdB family regulatory protein
VPNDTRRKGPPDPPASLVFPVPIYEFRCPNGHLFEVFHRMSDPDPEVCEVCGAAPLQKVLHPVPIHFKGSGFYSTDYGRKGRKRDSSDSSPADGGKKDEKKADKADKPEKKAAAKDS